MRACKVRTALGAANRSMSSLNSLVYDLNTYIFLANHTVSPLLYSKYENSRSKNNRTNHRKIERKGRIVERIISRGRGRQPEAGKFWFLSIIRRYRSDALADASVATSVAGLSYTRKDSLAAHVSRERNIAIRRRTNGRWVNRD